MDVVVEPALRSDRATALYELGRKDVCTFTTTLDIMET